MALVRTFVAVPVANLALQKALVAVQNELARAGGRVRWVPPHQFHYTLKFLGEIPAAAVATVQEAVGRAVVGVEPFTLSIRGLGAFPRPEAARVIWAGCGEGAESLSALAERVERELVAAGFPPERRRFSPHLTLGRVADGGLVPALTAGVQAGAGRRFGSTRVDSVLVYRSDLRPSGPVYTPLVTFPLD